MRWTLGRGAAAAPFDCERWGRQPPTAGLDTREGAHDRYTTGLAPSPGEPQDSFFERAARALLSYRIFPARRMRYQVCTPSGEITVGALIVQRIFVWPAVIETAVRVVDVFDRKSSGAREVGFSYVTLRGHMERGLATFFVRRDATAAAMTFDIESWSRPGNLIAVLTRPVSRQIQKRFTTEALANFREQLERPG